MKHKKNKKKLTMSSYEPLINSTKTFNFSTKDIEISCYLRSF